MYLVGFRVQKKCKLKVTYLQMFRLRLESSSVRIYFYKKYKGGKLKKFVFWMFSLSERGKKSSLTGIKNQHIPGVF